MTARPLRLPGRDAGLRVIPGRRTRHPAMAPWLVVSLVTVAAFLALIGARTALDQSAIQLAEINSALAEAASANQQLRIDIAEMENPARIAPLAEEQGLVAPAHREQLLVEGVGRDDGITDPGYVVAAGSEQPGPSS